MSKCNNADCFIHDTGQCHKLIDPVEKCPDYLQEGQKIASASKREIKNDRSNNLVMPWDGEFLTLESIPLVTIYSGPTIIGLVGSAKAGKTSYLATLFTLLQNHSRISDFGFAGSITIDAWDKLAHSVKFNGGDIQYPEPTPSNPNFYSLFHLKLKQEKTKHILFADSSGEVFNQWASDSNDSNAGSARWICANSSGFVFFIDCDVLVKRKAVAKSEVLDIAYRLKDEIAGRPIVIAWSKGDNFENVPKEIVQSLQSELDLIFPGHKSFLISNHSFSDSDKLCHINNIKLIESILDLISSIKPAQLDIADIETNDYFFKL